MYTEPKGQVELEKRLMSMLLDGDDPVLEKLRKQYKNSKIESRDFTGAGFYTNYKINRGISPLSIKRNFEIGDISATIDNIKDAVDFVLFIRDGYVSMLEGYMLTIDFWPEDVSNIELYYIDSNENNNKPITTRDLVSLRQLWEK